MTDDIQLRLQAYADGELNESDRRELEALSVRDKACRDQLDFILQISSVLRDNEPAAELPVSRHAYMDGIRDGIASECGIEELAEHQILAVQALVDGELTGKDQKQAQNLVATNGAARSLFAIMKSQTEAVSLAGEPPVACPESREFYWSRIESQIPHEEQSTRSDSRSRSFSWKSAISWILNPVFAPAALVAILCFFVGNQLEQPGIYETVEVSTAYVDQQSGFAVYYVDAPNFLSGALENQQVQ